MLTYEVFRVHRQWYYGADFKIVYRAAAGLFRGGDPYLEPAFVYAPSCALVFLPLLIITETAATAGGLLLSTAAVVALAFVVGDLFERRPFGRVSALTLLILSLSPTVWEAIETCNLSTFTSVLGLLAIAFCARGKWTLAALAIGTALTLKPVIAPMLLIFLFRRHFRQGALSLSVPILANLLCIPLLARPQAFVTEVLPTVLSGKTVTTDGNLSLYGFGQRVGLEHGLVGALQVAVLFLALETIRRVHRSVTTLSYLIVATVPVLCLMLVSHVNEGFYGLVAVPLLILLIAERRWGASIIAAFSLVLILVFGNIYTSYLGTHSASFGMLGQITAILAASLVAFSVLRPNPLADGAG